MRKFLICLIFLLLLGPIYVALFGGIAYDRSWQAADRSSAEIAPDPAKTSEAVIQVYAARAFNWRGIFAVHTWIATKAKNASYYEISQVLGWQKYRNLPVLVESIDLPDRLWYGEVPVVLLDLRGEQASKLISQVKTAVESYPYKMEYRVWPGPNSNTFVAWVGRQVPELNLQLPATAVGKDYLPNNKLFAKSVSGTGYQFSLFGLLGVQIAKTEGVEFNILGLNFGVDLDPVTLIAPALDRLGSG